MASTPRSTFKKTVASVAEADRRASETLMARLKRLTPEEFLREPPSIFGRLSLPEFREIVAVIAPDVKIPVAAEELDQAIGWGDRLTDWWRELSLLGRTCLKIMAMAVVMTIATIEVGPMIAFRAAPMTLKRSLETSEWPYCARLAWDTDGCVYDTHRDLTWDYVASQTRISVHDLYSLNRTLPPTFVPAGSKLIIWRQRGELVR